jgi:uncharacterized membrane protein YdjX (TVP38/TMEM64 family)
MDLWGLIGAAALVLGILVLAHVLLWGVVAGIILVVIGALILFLGFPSARGYFTRGPGPRV